MKYIYPLLFCIKVLIMTQKSQHWPETTQNNQKETESFI